MPSAVLRNVIQSFILRKFVNELDHWESLLTLSSRCPLHRNNWKVYAEASSVSDSKEI